jgi:hypothetical protein
MIGEAGAVHANAFAAHKLADLFYGCFAEIEVVFQGNLFG